MTETRLGFNPAFYFSYIHMIVCSVVFNPLKYGVIMWLHFECSAPYRSDLPFLISDIRALWHSVLSARVPECQKLKMVGRTFMAKCNSLKNWALKG